MNIEWPTFFEGDGESVTREHGPMAVALDNDKWLTLEAAENGECVLSLFTPCPWTLRETAERGLHYISLRERFGPSIVMGIHRGALVLAIRLRRGMNDKAAAELAARELIRYSDFCLNS